jgi:hypothetical protein
MDLSNLNFKKQGRVASRRDIKQVVIKEGKFFHILLGGLIQSGGKSTEQNRFIPF